jgi:hypothetical protein
MEIIPGVDYLMFFMGKNMNLNSRIENDFDEPGIFWMYKHKAIYFLHLGI